VSADPIPAQSAATPEAGPAPAAPDGPTGDSHADLAALAPELDEQPRAVSLPPLDAGVLGRFYDAANWAAIPHHSDAALYADGEFAVPIGAAGELELHRARYITVTGDWGSCSIVDYERLNPDFSPVRLRAFVRGRKAHNMDAIVYCNMDTAAEAIAALDDDRRGGLLRYPRLFWWIATLDGRQRTAAELCAELAKDWDAPEITPRTLWGNQATDTGAVDISNRFLPWLP
jgi:hypothetical protein